MKVKTEVNVYEQNGQEVEHVVGKKDVLITVESHWNRKAFVVIVSPTGKRFTVVGSELRRAIDNAQNKE